jgi:hypothetical protein
MYPEPPLLIRRALDDDLLPKGGAEKETFIPKGTDVFIATWNIQRSELFWEEPLKYNPDRFLKNFSNPTQTGWAGFKVGGNKLLYPNEVISDFAFLPFGGGSRKCVGDQFAMMEITATLALLMQRFDLSLAIPASEVGMRTGATIHTENGLMLKVKKRKPYVAGQTAAHVASVHAGPQVGVVVVGVGMGVDKNSHITSHHEAPVAAGGCPFDHHAAAAATAASISGSGLGHGHSAQPLVGSTVGSVAGEAVGAGVGGVVGAAVCPMGQL